MLSTVRSACVVRSFALLSASSVHLTKKEPAVKSEVRMWSVVAVLVQLPLAPGPRGREDAGLILINHKMLFLCTDTNLAGNNMNTETINLPKSGFQIQLTNKKESRNDLKSGTCFILTWLKKLTEDAVCLTNFHKQNPVLKSFIYTL